MISDCVLKLNTHSTQLVYSANNKQLLYFSVIGHNTSASKKIMFQIIIRFLENVLLLNDKKLLMT